MEGRIVVGPVLAVIMILAGLGGCAVRQGEPPGDAPGSVRPASGSLRAAASGKPEWLDLYRSRSIVGVSTVDRVVVVTFHTLGRRDEVFSHYAGKFGSEENFVSFRDDHDTISFLRDGYGVKITLRDPSSNIWSLEYHRQAI
ncbi:MAG: hypothetical protein HGB04_02270 [Chlorobiaceae bacterium]|nr:hypothetical protein [Chlorobiaceae bacterium]